jgi:hypothetical protein
MRATRQLIGGFLAMKVLRFGALCAATCVLAACSKDTGPTSPDKVPLAYSRFVNAIADSGAMDWRFVDVIANSPTAFGLAFRQTFPGAGYQATGVGARHLRLFQTSTDIVQTQKVLFDTTFTFVQGTHYTIIAAGNLRPGTGSPARLYVVEDGFTDPGSSIAIRALNAGIVAAADVYAVSDTSSKVELPSSPLLAGLGAFTASAYKTMSTGPLALRVTPSASTSVLVNIFAPAGLPADKTNNLSAVGGTSQAGSALSAIFFPPAVAGSLAANSAACVSKCAAPGVVYVVDRYPPSGF